MTDKERLEVLRELARVKAIFQLHAIKAAIVDQPPSSMTSHPMTQDSEATERPWWLEPDVSHDLIKIVSLSGLIATASTRRWGAVKAEEFAALIVDAVNERDSLLAQIEELKADNTKLREALAFIEGGYDNQDINHVDYRVGAVKVARAALKGGR